MKNTLGKVCLMSGLVVFSLSGCYGGGSMIVCQRSPRSKPHYIVHRAPLPPRHHSAPHFTMPKAPQHVSLPLSFRHNPNMSGGPGGHNGPSAPNSPRK